MKLLKFLIIALVFSSCQSENTKNDKSTDSEPVADKPITDVYIAGLKGNVATVTSMSYFNVGINTKGEYISTKAADIIYYGEYDNNGIELKNYTVDDGDSIRNFVLISNENNLNNYAFSSNGRTIAMFTTEHTPHSINHVFYALKDSDTVLTNKITKKFEEGTLNFVGVDTPYIGAVAQTPIKAKNTVSESNDTITTLRIEGNSNDISKQVILKRDAHGNPTRQVHFNEIRGKVHSTLMETTYTYH